MHKGKKNCRNICTKKVFLIKNKKISQKITTIQEKKPNFAHSNFTQFVCNIHIVFIVHKKMYKNPFCF